MEKNTARRERMDKMPVPKAHRSQRTYHVTNTVMARTFAVFLIIFGVVCIGFTEQIHSVFRYMLGSTMVAIGLCDIYRGIKKGEYRNNDTKLTSNGIIMMILGLIIMIYEGNVDSIIGSIWGMLGLVKGSEELNIAICHYFSKKDFMGEAIHAVIEICLAIMLLIEPLTSVRHHLVILGAELIWYGLQIIVECKNNSRYKNE